jgi:uncharacterized protein YndB with AHSA1/START domain
MTTPKHDRETEGEVRRFERRLAHRPEKVWRALTEHAELAQWFPDALPEAANDGAPLRVKEADPPRVLVCELGDESVRWELFPTPEGCLLVLTTEVKTTEAANDVPRACALAA